MLPRSTAGEKTIHALFRKYKFNPHHNSIEFPGMCPTDCVHVCLQTATITTISRCFHQQSSSYTWLFTMCWRLLPTASRSRLACLSLESSAGRRSAGLLAKCRNLTCMLHSTEPHVRPSFPLQIRESGKIIKFDKFNCVQASAIRPQQSSKARP